MHKVICHGGRRRSYNTGAAKKIGEYRFTPNNPHGWWAEDLYITKTGMYFLHCHGGNDSLYGNVLGAGEQIKPLTLAAAQDWGEKQLDGDRYEAIFGAVADDEGDDERGAVALSLPAVMLENLRARRESSGLSVNQLIVNALKKAGY